MCVCVRARASERAWSVRTSGLSPCGASSPNEVRGALWGAAARRAAQVRSYTLAFLSNDASLMTADEAAFAR